ncbi:MAG: D-sedoheptulose 7-phosphate isomerase [Saprospiraceae bacterium]|nr:D-sedoheptulose 7-phosphate isomerase [Saprospiraceae bacterium]
MSKIQEIITQSILVKQELIDNPKKQELITAIADILVSSLQKGGRIYFCGNGGSAADAQHLAAELSGRFYTDRPALAAEALHANTSYLTAVGNDYGYDFVFSRMMEGVGTKNDVLIGISTSGNSKNIIKAFEICRSKGIPTVGFTGSKGGAMKELSDYWIPVASDDTPRIQESHILIGHIICQLVEEKYFNLGK